MLSRSHMATSKLEHSKWRKMYNLYTQFNIDVYIYITCGLREFIIWSKMGFSQTEGHNCFILCILLIQLQS